MDYQVRVNPPRFPGMEYVQMIRLHQKLTCPLGTSEDQVACPYEEPHSHQHWPDESTIQASARANPGSLWLIGNEMDRLDWPGGRQDEMLPELYAVAYHEMRSLIRAADPTARIAIGGIIQPTPLRLLYLDRVWDAYIRTYGSEMPVDVWNIHAFLLQEERNAWGRVHSPRHRRRAGPLRGRELWPPLPGRFAPSAAGCSCGASSTSPSSSPSAVGKACHSTCQGPVARSWSWTSASSIRLCCSRTILAAATAIGDEIRPGAAPLGRLAAEGGHPPMAEVATVARPSGRDGHPLADLK